MRNKILLSESLVILMIILFLWADELLDLPHWLFGAVATPVNWMEAVMESGIVLIIGIIFGLILHKLLQRIQFLERIVPICSSCKKIRDEKGQWNQIETYIHENAQTDFTHGLCPECARKLYPDLYKNS